jgi:hypothetical protein
MDTGTARTEPIDPAGALPFGLDERHARPPRTAWLRNLGVAVFIGLPIAAALAGLLGGGAPRVTTAATPAALMSVTAPAVLRSGNWFETEVIVTPAAPVDDLTIRIDKTLWHRLSIDTMVPDAESAEALDGRYIYHFGKVEARQRFTLKLDGQIQPAGLRRLTGAFEAADGERPLVRVPIRIMVLP